MAVIRQRLRVMGIVQGVGFRPFVARLAGDLALTGSVVNTSAAVVIEIEGPSQALTDFCHRLESELPRAATIEHVEVETLPVLGGDRFDIAASQTTAQSGVGIPADLAICVDCCREMDDPADRRYRYPFINCTACGPRYSIVDGLPYDRPATTMRHFPLCPDCTREYQDLADRRYHAQPIACPVCGPQLEFRPGNTTAETALRQAIDALRMGQIGAIRGIGGFHLACDARNPQAVEQLRRRKARGDQPFAILVKDLATAREFVDLDEQSAALLNSAAAPIVLLPKRDGDWLAPGNGYLGVMLPYSPLHRLLAAEIPALVMTSANRHGEPIETTHPEALEGLADFFLLHNRDIVAPCDDSVVRLYQGKLLAIRRGRGYAPLTLRLPVEAPCSLAVGAELKAAFAIGDGQRILISPHLGDMENVATLESFEKTLGHLSRLYRLQPTRVIHDAHPGYLSTQWARRSSLETIAVQHHRAHVASVMAEYGIAPDHTVAAAVFDGTGYGDDGAIWGGEFFAGALTQLDRRHHLPYVSLPGGDASARRPALSAIAHLRAVGIDWRATPAGASLTEEEARIFDRQMERNLNCHPTSSVGRLFDAAASLLGIRHRIAYEAQAAIELEAIAARWFQDEAYAADPGHLDQLWRELIEDEGPLEAKARRFHGAIARWTCDRLQALASQTRTIILSGGVFQNILLLRLVSEPLTKQGLKLFAPRLLPPNDGGLALGQMYLAAVQRP